MSSSNHQEKERLKKLRSLQHYHGISAKQISSLPRTACFTASVRATESLRPDALFSDPFAYKLALNTKFKPRGSNKGGSKSPLQSEDAPFVQVRTRYIDDWMKQRLSTNSDCSHPIQQIVMLGAGMDARAFRMKDVIPSYIHLYEVDVEEILNVKESLLSSDLPVCHRHVVRADLTQISDCSDNTASNEGNHWTSVIQRDPHLFNPELPTMWIGEGLVMYFTDDHVKQLLNQIDSLSAPGSVIFIDIFNQELIQILNNTTSSTAYDGVYKSGYEFPEQELFHDRCQMSHWTANSIQIGESDANYGRYHRLPIIPRDTPAPRTYFVTAAKI